MTHSRLIAYRAFSDIAGKAAFFAVTVLAARRLSYEGFGLFAVGATMGWIAAVASDFGMQMHLARAVARDPANAGSVLRAWLPSRLAAAAVALAVAAAVAIVWPGGLHRPTLLAFVCAYLASGLVEFVHYFYRGLGRSDIESTLTLWHRVGTLGCSAFVLWTWPDATLLALAIFLPAAATAACSVWTARRLSAAGTRVISRRLAAEGYGPSRAVLLRDVAPIGAGVLLSALYFRVDVFLLQAWRGTEAVALYNAVFRSVDALRLFPAAVMAVALPVLVRATDAGPLVRVSGWVTGFGVLTAAALWISADWIVPLIYGDDYRDAVPAFRILAAAYPLMSLNYALTHQLIGWDRHRAYAALCLAALAFNVALNARLIPSMSIQGAAWATLWTEGLLTVGCAAALARSVGFREIDRRAVTPGLKGPAYVRGRMQM